jgi:acyl-CoA dehydrogenase
VNLTQTSEHDDLRAGVREVCERFDGPYWRGLEPDTYPTEFVQALTAAGYLGALVPEEYGGGGATITEASVILEEISASGGNPSACHAQMYIMGTLLRHGTDEQKRATCPAIAERAPSAAGLRGHRARRRLRDHADPHPGRARARGLAHQRPEDLDVPRPATPTS